MVQWFDRNHSAPCCRIVGTTRGLFYCIYTKIELIGCLAFHSNVISITTEQKKKTSPLWRQTAQEVGTDATRIYNVPTASNLLASM
jgi:hypothetical protein